MNHTRNSSCQPALFGGYSPQSFDEYVVNEEVVYESGMISEERAEHDSEAGEREEHEGEQNRDERLEEASEQKATHHELTEKRDSASTGFGVVQVVDQQGEGETQQHEERQPEWSSEAHQKGRSRDDDAEQNVDERQHHRAGTALHHVVPEPVASQCYVLRQQTRVGLALELLVRLGRVVPQTAKTRAQSLHLRRRAGKQNACIHTYKV